MRTADNTHELEILTYDGLRLRVGETPPDELERIIRAGGPRGEIYAKLKALRDKYADEIRRRFPKLPRRVSGYNLDCLLPENGFHVARALVGSEGTLVTILEATLNLVPEPEGARRCWCSAIPDVYAAGDHLMEILPLKPTALEGMDHLLFECVKDKGDKDADLELLPPGQGLPAGRVRRRQQGGLRRPGPPLHGDAEEAGQRRRHEAVRRSRTRRR